MKPTRPTGIKCTTEWWRNNTLFYLMRPSKEYLPDHLLEKRPKFTHKVGTFADPEAPEVDAARQVARAAFLPVVEATLAELKARVAAATARGDAAYPITFAEAVSDYCGQAKIKTLKDRKAQLERYVVPELGRLACSTITFRDVNAMLANAARKGDLTRGTVSHVRKSFLAVMLYLYGREQIPNPELTFDRVKMPEFDQEHEEDRRPRTQLTDDEIVLLVTHEPAPLELRTMAMTSRCLGGMRTSDLHAWDWLHVDTQAWDTAFVPRPKTEGTKGGASFGERHKIAAVLVPFLKRWWLASGRPGSGPVFGAQRARRASTGKKGARKGRGISYAAPLRYWLKECGVVRHEVHHDTTVTRATDFHSFRRAYASALARANVNAQTSMILTGHSDMETHMRYVREAVAAEYPEAALPKL